MTQSKTLDTGSDGMEDRSAGVEEHTPLFGRKRREFQILVQTLGKDDHLIKLATFTDLKSATSYVEMRERVERLKCLVYVVEVDPEIVGTMTFVVTVQDQPKAEDQTEGGSP